MCDSADPLDMEGIPYEFDAFELLGFETLDQFRSGAWAPDPGFAVRTVRRELTPDMAIVRFL